MRQRRYEVRRGAAPGDKWLWKSLQAFVRGPSKPGQLKVQHVSWNGSSHEFNNGQQAILNSSA